MTRDHGGNLDVAQARFGGRLEDWIDLSTGINRRPYPVPPLTPRHWSMLPSRSDIDSLHAAARQAYATTASVLAVAGAQAAIQLLPDRDQAPDIIGGLGATIPSGNQAPPISSSGPS